MRWVNGGRDEDPGRGIVVSVCIVYILDHPTCKKLYKVSGCCVRV